MDLDVTGHLSDLDSVLPSLDFAFPSAPFATDNAAEIDALTLAVFPESLPLLESPPHSAHSVSTHDPSDIAKLNHRATPPVQRAALAALPVAASASAMKKRPPGNVSHTRRCRAKVNQKLQQLLALLPATESAAIGPFALPPSSALSRTGASDAPSARKPALEVKHKAQILKLAIDRFHAIRVRNIALEMQLAMSSPHHMRRWVRSVVESSPTLTRALQPFMSLICLTRAWKYAELWQPSAASASGDTLLRYVAGAVPPNVSADERVRLRAYRARSKNFKFMPRSGVPGRVYLTKRPEWLPLLDDEVAFPRAPYAVEHKLEVTFAVPVIVAGDVKMVVEFYDTDRRNYDPQIVNVANEIAAMFGSAFDVEQPVLCPVLSSRL